MNREARYPYEDAGLAPENRIADLTGRLTVEDKVGLLLHPQTAVGDPEQPDRYGRTAAAAHVRESRITHLLAQGAADGRELAQWHNQVQRIALEHPLRIPVTLSSDPRHSAAGNPLTANRSGGFSRWPEPLGLAAVGSTELVEEFGDIIRREYLATGLRVALHPQIDLATEPRWARIPHTFGEDAQLTARLVRAFLRGLQGPGLGPDSVAATTKHFPGGGPQKDGLDPHFSDGREQVYPGGRFDYHLEPFVAAIEAGTAQIMPYYGMPVGTEWEEVGFAFNKGIITDLLRRRLGFDGVVVTDFGVITGYHEAFPAKAWGVEHLTREERVVKLLDAGVDQFGGEGDAELVLGLVKSGAVPERLLDDPVRRLLEVKFRLGLFDDRRFADEEAATAVVGCAAHREAGVRAQQRSLVLLKNEPAAGDRPLLPLEPGITVYVEGVDPAAFDGLATVTTTPEAADVAVIRTPSPSYQDPAKGFLGSMHKGSLEFPPEQRERLTELVARVPAVLDVRLDRPAALTGMLAPQAVLGSFGTDDRPFAEVLFGQGAEPEGTLPFDLPSSMRAVEASRTDVPFDTADPLFRCGWGLRYPRR
ncbi:glycoside hydrolase family 3 N-terminal domain-containing protein [Amycolatopsis sp. NEAU-NG30]|uniref:beta-glucosidase n=1 Tax=Amycolatopsis melonis TaxID=3156488 RepID=A0ABV0L7G0_9PSEU